MHIPVKLYNSIVDTMPILCVDVLIMYSNKCLLLLRDNEPAKGQYWFPGGRVLKNEYIKDAAVRKAKEETNLDCSFLKIISVEETIFKKNENMLTDVHTVNVCCQMEVTNIDEISADYLHAGYKWVDKLDACYNSAVNNPLALLGFDY